MAIPCRAVLLFAVAFLGASAALADALLTFRIVIKDGRIVPARLEVPAGKKIKLAITNESPDPSEFESAELRVEKVLSPGASSFVVIHALKPGAYRFFDEFHPDTSEMILIAK